MPLTAMEVGGIAELADSPKLASIAGASIADRALGVNASGPGEPYEGAGES